MRRVIVTGATGFVGQHTLEPLLQRGFEVHALSTQPRASDHVTWHTLDLFDTDKTTALISHIRPSHLLHFAWVTQPGAFWSALENLDWVAATLHLVRQFAACGGQRVVVAGTCAEYDWNHPCAEHTNPFSPNTLYGSAKRSLYLILKAFAEQEKLSLAWGHLFFLYGPHEHPKRFLPTIVQGLLSNRNIPCSHGEQIRDFLHTKDAADAFVTLLDSPLTGNINIASGQGVSLKEIATKLARHLGGEDLLQFGALAAPAHEPARIVADVHRLTTELGWTPRYSLDQGLIEVIDTWHAPR